jgi:hypothetical protein
LVAYPVEALVAYPVVALVAYPVGASLVAYPVGAFFAELDHQFDNLSVASLVTCPVVANLVVASLAYLVVAYPVEASLVACPVEASFVELDHQFDNFFSFLLKAFIFSSFSPVFYSVVNLPYV